MYAVCTHEHATSIALFEHFFFVSTSTSQCVVYFCSVNDTRTAVNRDGQEKKHEAVEGDRATSRKSRDDC